LVYARLSFEKSNYNGNKQASNQPNKQTNKHTNKTKSTCVCSSGGGLLLLQGHAAATVTGGTGTGI
jgi:hypothetical protein